NARLELLDGERFDEVIVGPAVQPANPARNCIVRRQDYDGNRAAPRPQAPQDLHTFEVGEAEIKNDESVIPGRQGRVGLVTAADTGEGGGVSPQQARDPGRQLAVILRKQYTHDASLAGDPKSRATGFNTQSILADAGRRCLAMLRPVE